MTQKKMRAETARFNEETIRHTILVWTTALIMTVLALSFMSSESFAQSADNKIQSPVEGTVPGDSLGNTSNSELWRALKAGEPGKISGKDGKAATAIQTNGQDWRLLRTGPLITYTAWGLLGTIGLLGLFFAVRGRIRIGHGGPSGETILRFKLVERLGHWLLASSFIVLALTGLNILFGRELLLPLLGKDVFASITNFGKYIHNYVAFAFMVALAWVTVTWVAYNVPHPRDLVWFARGGGILGGGHPAAKKFNAGQKVIFWVVVLGGVSLSFSGWTLLFPFSTSHFADTFGIINSIFATDLPTVLTPLQEQQLAQVWHGLMSVFMICVVIAHIYIGSVGMEGAIDAVTSGDVDLTWAREHHSLWVEEEEAKMAAGGKPSGSMQAAE